MNTTENPPQKSPKSRPRDPIAVSQITQMQSLIFRDFNRQNVGPALRVRLSEAWLELERVRLAHRDERRARTKAKQVEKHQRAPEPAMVEDDPAAGDPPAA